MRYIKKNDLFIQFGGGGGGGGREKDHSCLIKDFNIRVIYLLSVLCNDEVRLITT